MVMVGQLAHDPDGEYDGDWANRPDARESIWDRP